MATVGDIKRKIKDELKLNYHSNEISTLSKTLFAHFLEYSSTDYLLNDENVVSDIVNDQFKDAISRLNNHEPIAYITGFCSFYGLTYRVSKSVLIPRPETEELIEWIKEENQNPNSILDLCTGSGCIAISLKSLYTKSEVEGWDISLEALEMAKSNAIYNQHNVKFKEVDVLHHIPQKHLTYDIIVSNPPYVMESEKSVMHSNVLEFEPHLALFVDDSDPLIFYRTIVKLAETMLNPNGKLYFEINEALGKETLKLLNKEIFTNCVIKQDINGKDRMILAQKR